MRPSHAQPLDNLNYFPLPLSVRVIGSVLKQLSEKLDNVRCLAGEIITDMISDGSKYELPIVVDRYLLIESLKAPRGTLEGDVYQKAIRENEVNWSSPHVTFPMMLKAMNSTAYHTAVVSGLVISVGGITESVVKASSAAMVEWVRVVKRIKNLGLGRKLGRTLCDLLKGNKGNDRVVVPCLKTINLLLKNELPTRSSKFGESDDFMNNVLDCCKVEVGKSRNFGKIIAVIDVVARFAERIVDQFDENENGGNGDENGNGKEDDDKVGISNSADITRLKSTILSFLCHPFPRIRSYASSQLYSVMATNDFFVTDSVLRREIEDIVLAGNWEIEDDAREERRELARRMGVEVKEGGKKEKKRTENVKDDMESYMCLVKEAGR